MVRVLIGKKLKKLRQKAGMTQRAFADTLGVHWRSVQDWEAERTEVDSFKAKALLEAASELAGKKGK